MLKKRKQNKNEIIENPAVSKGTGIVITIVMTLLAVAFLFPIFLVLMNSFKNKLYISEPPSLAKFGYFFQDDTIM